MKKGFDRLFQKLPIHFLSQGGGTHRIGRSVVVKSEWTDRDSA